jgi:hypothetical protein
MRGNQFAVATHVYITLMLHLPEPFSFTCTERERQGARNGFKVSAGLLAQLARILTDLDEFHSTRDVDSNRIV